MTDLNGLSSNEPNDKPNSESANEPANESANESASNAASGSTHDRSTKSRRYDSPSKGEVVIEDEQRVEIGGKNIDELLARLVDT